ncbi:MAG: hypothetical protein HW405_212, partial [Candidatus Berkelbacteria bacterium]|nr:hypothetical protein [Candidatus Berkelbacteria bacterium]
FFSFLLWPQATVKASEVWEQVGGMGLGDADNTMVITLETLGNAIYAGIGNDTDGGRIYRSTDGNTWTKVNNDGFGHVALNAIVDFEVFGESLFASADDDNAVPAQPGEIWKSNDGITWIQSGNDGLGHNHNTGFYEMAEFNGQLYAGSRNATDGGEIYRTADGTNWNLIAASAGGFGDANNTIILSLKSFGGWLYAGTHNDNGAQVWRSNNGTDWNLHLDFALFNANITGVNHFFEFNNLLHWFGIDAAEGASITRKTTDILTETFIGFTGDANNIWYSQNAVISDGLLYGGTRNNVTGGELWYTSDGVNLTQIGLDGFGNVDNFAIYALTFKDYLYVGLSTGNALKGCEIWRRYSSSSFGMKTKKLPDGQQNDRYGTTLETSGGQTPYQYTLIKGALPSGLTLDENSGEIRGTPKESGDFQFIIQVQDSSKKEQKSQSIYNLKIVAGASDTNISELTILPLTGANLN